MYPKAPRYPARLWQCRARGALLMFLAWLTAAIPALAADTITSSSFIEPILIRLN